MPVLAFFWITLYFSNSLGIYKITST
jgi:hypothetical protein